VVKVISGWWTVETAAFYVAPPLLMCGVIVAGEVRRLRERSPDSLQQTLKLSLWCLAGFALPIACFLLLYAHGGLMDWIRGVFVYPARRLELAKASPPPVYAIAVAAVGWSLGAAAILLRRWWTAPIVAVLLA
jgi:hypothetical protein